MTDKRRLNQVLRWLLVVAILAAGIGAAWALGRGRSEPGAATSSTEQPAPVVQYAAWQPVAGARAVLYRSANLGETWQPVPLKTGIASVVAWASDGADRVAVALSDGGVFRSGNRGDRWTSVAASLPASSLAFGEGGELFIGTSGRGVWLQRGSDDPEPLAAGPSGAPVEFLATVGGRLFAATPAALHVSSDGGLTFTGARIVPGRLSALVALDSETLLVGTEGSGLLVSRDAGLSWQPAVTGLGQAAGLTLRITALRADPVEPNVLYAGVSYLVGGTQLHESAAGAFATLDGGSSWVKLAGPSFPEAQRAADLVPVPSRPLTTLAATDDGLQAYQPDLAAAFSLLGSGSNVERANAALVLGMARAEGAGQALLAALQDADNAVAQAASVALGRLDDPSTLPSLEAALSGSDTQVRRNAAKALGLMRADEAVGPLATLLIESDASAAGAAAEALRRIGSPAAIDALLAPLADTGMTARRHAALAELEVLGEAAVEPLAALLASADAPVRRNAAEALGWIASPSATGALLDVLGDEQESVRAEAAWALGEIADPAAQRALAQAGSSDPSAIVRQAASLALARLAERPAATVSGLAAVRAALGTAVALRWLLLGLSVAIAGLLAARNLKPSAVRVPRRGSGR
ncbi:MAG TPA: HEAT repeat domain-containing protein [Anaerolineae bacterium]|nr:HEAT repeat domain-containing protein [Anaerolineae bacterium]